MDDVTAALDKTAPIDPTGETLPAVVRRPVLPDKDRSRRPGRLWRTWPS